jgi:hypothetical protein
MTPLLTKVLAGQLVPVDAAVRALQSFSLFVSLIFSAWVKRMLRLCRDWPSVLSRWFYCRLFLEVLNKLNGGLILLALVCYKYFLLHLVWLFLSPCSIVPRIFPWLYWAHYHRSTPVRSRPHHFALCKSCKYNKELTRIRFKHLENDW